MDILSILIGAIIGMLITGLVTYFVMWYVEVTDSRNEKKWSDADFDRIFHDAWHSGFEYGKCFGGTTCCKEDETK